MNIKIVNQKRLLLSSESAFIFYKKNALFLASDPLSSGKKLCDLPIEGKKSLFCKIPLAERALRLFPRCAEWVGRNSFILARGGHIYYVDCVKRRVSKEFSFPPPMGGPIYLTKVQNLDGFEDGIYCGTYVGRDALSQVVSIFRRSLSGVWTEVFRFPLKKVLHIHNIIPDYEGKRLLILTGDTDSESGIWQAKDDFANVRPILYGSQQFRSCVAFPEKGHIFFATDTPLEKNYLYDYDEETGNTRIVRSMPGPVIYGKTIYRASCKIHLMATSVEPDSKQKGLSYLLSRRLGPGVQDNNTYVFAGNVHNGFQSICSFEKDIWPMALFQFGNVVFPGGDMKRIFLCPQSVKRYAGKTVQADISLLDEYVCAINKKKL